MGAYETISLGIIGNFDPKSPEEVDKFKLKERHIQH
jgi:hypothetical protein